MNKTLSPYPQGPMYEEDVRSPLYNSLADDQLQQIRDEQVAIRTTEILNLRMPEVLDAIWSDGDKEDEFQRLDDAWVTSTKKQKGVTAFAIQQFLYEVAEGLAEKEIEA